MKTTEIKSKTEPENILNAGNKKGIENHKKKINQIEANVNKYFKTNKGTKTIKTTKMEGPPFYPPSEDRYKQAEKEMDVNPEDISIRKLPNEKEGTLNVKNFKDDMSGDDLDDIQEKVGSENEADNYWIITMV